MTHSLTHSLETDKEAEVTGRRGVGIDESIGPVEHRPMAGDWQDDDGLVIDDTLEPNPNPAFPATWPTHAVPNVDYDDGPKSVNRFLTTKISLTVGSDPVQILPRDPNRKSLTVSINSATATDQVRIASEKSETYGAGAISVGNPVDFDCYTGAVWIYFPTGTGPVTVHVWSITE